MTRLIGEWIGARVPFIVGASAAATDDAVAFAAAGAQGRRCRGDDPDAEGVRRRSGGDARFLPRRARGSGIDIMLQNAPAPMGIGLSLEKVAELARAVDGIRYVKEEAPPSGQRITKLTELAGDSLLAVFGGAGARYVIDELTRGAKGTMPACEITELHVEMFDRFHRKDEAGARDLFERTLPLLNMQADLSLAADQGSARSAAD